MHITLWYKTELALISVNKWFQKSVCFERNVVQCFNDHNLIATCLKFLRCSVAMHIKAPTTVDNHSEIYESIKSLTQTKNNEYTLKTGRGVGWGGVGGWGGGWGGGVGVGGGVGGWGGGGWGGGRQIRGCNKSQGYFCRTTPSYQYRCPHVKDKTILWPYYL